MLVLLLLGVTAPIDGRLPVSVRTVIIQRNVLQRGVAIVPQPDGRPYDAMRPEHINGCVSSQHRHAHVQVRAQILDRVAGNVAQRRIQPINVVHVQPEQVRPLDVVVLGNGCRQSLGTLGRAAIRPLLLLLLLARVCTWSTLLLESALLCLGLIVTRLNEDLLQLRLLYDDREFIMMEEAG
uniref:Secreted protein n=1 Tax=Anopheles coluzzii TaxID=1518534 RepID=A0A8W7PNX1_ANOCL